MKQTLTLLCCYLLCCTLAFAQTATEFQRSVQKTSGHTPAVLPAMGEVLQVLCSELPSSAPTAGFSGPDAPCSSAIPLQCGELKANQTNSGAGNNFTTSFYNCITGGVNPNTFDAPDKVYSFTLTEAKSVNISMEITSGGNLDFFVFNLCQSGSCIGGSANNSPFEFAQFGLLPAGTYYIVVDGRDGGIGTFNLQVSCGCDASERWINPAQARLLTCENFEGFNLGDSVSRQSVRWEKYSPSAKDAVVAGDATNRYMKMTATATAGPDLYLKLGNWANSGIFRLSFRILVEAGKEGRYDIWHRAVDDPNGRNEAQRTVFNANGTANVFPGDNSNGSIPFQYKNGVWNKVVQIFDITNDKTQLWINDEFVASWQFSLGRAANGAAQPSTALQAASFWASNPNTDFRVDDLSFWRPIDNCSGSSANPLCIKNGTSVGTTLLECRMYTEDELTPCNSVCDLGGTNIYRGENFSGTLKISERAPALLLQTPEVQASYNNNVPPNLAADVYVFYRDNRDENGQSIGVSCNSPSSSVRCFVFNCRDENAVGNCVDGQKFLIECDINGGSINVNENDCSDFFYIVVTGVPGASYNTLNIIPNGNCPTDGGGTDTLGVTTNNTPLTVNGTTNLTPDPAYFSSAGLAYKSCYNGTRTYTGAEAFYRFTLDAPSEVTIRLDPTNSASQMGIFLSSFLCGRNCISYAENTASDDIAELKLPLSEGVYHIIVDRNGNTGSANFSLTVTAKAYSPFLDLNSFINNNFENCPVDNSAQPHNVIINSTAFNFSPTTDQVVFRYRDANGALASKKPLAYNWPSTAQPVPFQIKPDLSGGTKCSYITGDSFFVALVQYEPGQRRRTYFKPTFESVTAPGVNAGIQFLPNGTSVIKKLEALPSVRIGAQTPVVVHSAAAGSDTILITAASELWRVSVEPPVSWLSVTPTESNGADEVRLVFNTANPSAAPRTTYLRFYFPGFPDYDQFFLRVKQRGNCNAPNTVDVTASSTSICAGSPVTLTPNVGTGLQHIYAYKWNTGDTSRIITKTPPVGTTTYSVTITNLECFSTNSDSSPSITVNTLPAGPTGANNPIICRNVPTPPLSVNAPPSGIIVDWYDDAGGTTLLQSGPPNTYTPAEKTSRNYYARARFTAAPGCASAVPLTAVSLTVRDTATLSTSPPVCAPNLQTYELTATTDGASLTVTPSTGVSITLSNGVYTIKNVPKGTSLTVKATHSNGCVTSKTVFKDCLCPNVSPPTSNGDVTVCQGTPATLSVSVSNLADETADWFSSSGNLIQPPNTTTLNISNTAQPGTFEYWAQAKLIAAPACTSATRARVLLHVRPSLTLLSTDTVCTPVQEKYALTLSTNAESVTADRGSVSGPASGTATVQGIPSGQAVQVTAQYSVAPTCSVSKTYGPIQCKCPSLPKPTSLGNVGICAGDAPKPLKVSVQSGLKADWFVQQTGGVVMPGGQGTDTFTPPSANVYFVESRDADGCVSTARTAVRLYENPRPTLSVNSEGCKPDLKYYTLQLSTSGSSCTASAGKKTGPNASGIVTLDSIPENSLLSITARHDSSGCTTVLSNKSIPDCPCPVMGAPTDPLSASVCPGGGFLPLKVTVSADETVDWYDQAISGIKLQTGTAVLKDYTPSSDGDFFALRRSLVHGCVSASRTKVSHTRKPLPDVTVLSTDCAINNTSYKINLYSNTPNLSVSISGPVISNLGNNLYSINPVPVGTNLSITANLDGCMVQKPVASPVCTCVTLPNKPQSLVGDTVRNCTGAGFQPLTVNLNGPLEVAEWFEQETGGIKLTAQNSNTYLPTQAGAYFAQAKNIQTECVSAGRVKIVVVVDAKPTITLLDTLCEPSLVEYRLRLSSSGQITALPYLASQLPDGTWDIAGVPTGATLSLVSRNPQNTACLTQQSVKVLDTACPCPVLSKPASDGDRSICMGDPLPFLEVKVADPITQTADWYATETSPAVLSGGSGTLQFKPQPPPTIPGTYEYWVQTRDKSAQKTCVSNGRTLVRLVISAKPTAAAGSDTIRVCTGATLLLTGSFSGASTAVWASSLGGSFLPDEEVGHGETIEFKPLPGMTTTVLSLQTVVPAGSACPAAKDEVLLKISPTPSAQRDTAFCSPDLKTYTVVVSVQNADAVKINGIGLPLKPLGIYTLADIPAGQPTSVTLINTITLCSAVLSFPAPDCGCPTVNKPGFVKNEIACDNSSTLPQLTVTVQSADYTADWYDKATGGTALKTSVLSFDPPSAGPYFAEARNKVNGCLSADRTLVRLDLLPSPLANAGPDQVVCPGYPATLSANLGVGLSYEWSSGATTPSIAVPAVAKTYGLTVTNTNGCKAVDSAAVSVYPSLQAQIAESQALRCFGDKNGQLTLSVIAPGAGGPYDLKWSTGSVFSDIFNLPAGTYTATVTDKAGCRDTVERSLTQPPPLALDSAHITKTPANQPMGAVEVFLSGGTPPYQFKWTRNGFSLPLETKSLVDSIFAGEYQATVTDANGCVLTVGTFLLDTLTVGVPTLWEGAVFKIFPNPTNGRLYLQFDLTEPLDVEVQLYDLLGRPLAAVRSGGSQQTGTLELDLSAFPNGLYMARIGSEGRFLIKMISLKK